MIRYKILPWKDNKIPPHPQPQPPDHINKSSEFCSIICLLLLRSPRTSKYRRWLCYELGLNIIRRSQGRSGKRHSIHRCLWLVVFVGCSGKACSFQSCSLLPDCLEQGFQRAKLTSIRIEKGHKLGHLLQQTGTLSSWPLLSGHSMLTVSATVYHQRKACSVSWANVAVCG